MTALRVWQMTMGLLVLIGSILFFAYRENATSNRSHDAVYWKAMLDEQAKALFQGNVGDRSEISPMLPQILLRNDMPAYWTAAFNDSIILGAQNFEKFICPEGKSWIALTGKVNEQDRWIGLVAEELLIVHEGHDQNPEKTTFLNSCTFTAYLSFPGNNNKLWQWWFLAALILLPWYFVLRSRDASHFQFGALVLGLAAYFGLLSFIVFSNSGVLFPFSGEDTGDAYMDTCILVTLYKAFFIFYLGLAFYQHKAWYKDTVHTLMRHRAFPVLVYAVMLLSIIAGTQLLGAITQKGWMGIHFLHRTYLDLRVLTGTTAWLFGMSGVILIALRLTRHLHESGIRTKQRMIAMAMATVLSLIISLLPGVTISVAGLLFAGLASMLFLDLFVEEDKPSLSWILAAFLLISALTTALTYHQIIRQEKTWVTSQLKSWEIEGDFSRDSLRIYMSDWSAEDRSLYRIFHRSPDNNTEDLWEMVSIEGGNKQSLAPGKVKDRGLKEFASGDSPEWMIARTPLNVLQPLALFSKIFAFLIGLFTLLTIINYKWPILPDRFGLAIFAQHSLRTRIQIGILATILMSFLIIGGITQYYFTQSDKTVEYRAMERQIQRLTDLVYSTVENSESEDAGQRIPELENTFNAEINWFNSDDPPARKIAIPISVLNQWSNGLPFQSRLEARNETIVFNARSDEHLLSIRWGKGQVLTPFASNMMSTLLSVYVFLFLLAGSIGLAIANSITWPIEILAEKIRQVRLGKQNEPLEWQNPDELGDLIRVYNEMIKKLDQSARSMVKLERDMAWREMAQQVAHEIKNPLTPMKLSIQYLMQSVGSDPERLQQLVPRVSETLLEQVDNLSTIATEFSNFGTLPKANNSKVNLNEVVASVHDLFRKRDDLDINLYVPIDDLWVFADRNYMIRILNNLVKNAIQAIPADRNGKIDIILKKVGDAAQITIRDNGVGIPDEMKEKVFQPNFTTKSSGTGLGLAICASLLESFNGLIYFETVPGQGTEFFVELPLMLVENNFQHIPRVDLDE